MAQDFKIQQLNLFIAVLKNNLDPIYFYKYNGMLILGQQGSIFRTVVLLGCVLDGSIV